MPAPTTGSSAEDLLRSYTSRPVRAVQLTAENAEALGTLDGIEYSPETDTDERSFLIQLEENYREGLEFGDWIIESAVPGRWTCISAEAYGDEDWVPFEGLYTEAIR